MAKKKQSAVVSERGRRTKKSAPGRASSPKPGDNKQAARTAARQRELSNELIGQTAGQVWQILADQGPQTMAALKKSIAGPDDLVLLAVGWLAREGKLAFDTSGRSATVSLQ